MFGKGEREVKDRSGGRCVDVFVRRSVRMLIEEGDVRLSFFL